MRALVAAAVVASCMALAFAASPRPQIVYDSDFDGYVPIVDSIQRPDLVYDEETGRVPSSYSRALKLTRRSLRKESKRKRTRNAALATDTQPSRRWTRRVAAVTDLEIVDTRAQPIEGARIYRYVDPSLYPVNDSPTGARLYDTHRYLPYPFPAVDALKAVQLHDEFWQDQFMASVRPTSPDITQDRNPWRRDSQPTPSIPVEYLGATDVNGHIRSISGVFNVHDTDRFRWATAPSQFRVGFIVIADGYHPAFSEKRFDRGGIKEQRTIRLLNSVGFEVFQSAAYKVAARLADKIKLQDDRPLHEVLDDVTRLVVSLETELYKVPERDRVSVNTEIEAVLLSRLVRRASPQRTVELARRAANLTPGNPARRFRYARALAASRGVLAAPAPPAAPQKPDTTLSEAEHMCAQVIKSQPGFTPAYPLLYSLMLRRGASDVELRRVIERLLAVRPFDRWARARMGVLNLRASRPVEAFDHLRYTWMMDPGMAGDRELGVALADHHWKMGLTSKAGFFSRMLSGRTPEDPGGRALSISR